MNLNRQKVIVTGACGFIGSHLVELLVSRGYAVSAFVYYNAFNHWGWLEWLPKNILKQIKVIPGDIRDSHGVRNALRNVDMVFHLAALIGIPYSYESPQSYVDTNITGTLNILQAAREEGVKRLLVTSTSEVYGSARYVPIDESHPRQGQSPYAAAKIGADYLSESFYRSFRLPVVIVRPFNTYGPRQSARAVIPTIIIQLLSGIKEIRLGSLSPSRDFVYVKDTVQGFMQLATAKDALGKEVNIATQKEITIEALVKKIIKLINPKARIISDATRLRPQDSEIERLLGSSRRLKELTGWQPQYSLEEGLKETINWFKGSKHLKLYKAGIYNV